MSEQKIPVIETFISVSGEGMDVGLPVLFLRLAGCNFFMDGKHPCHFCDTSYALDANAAEAKWFTAEEIQEQVSKVCMINRINRIVVTGGEPLSHPIKDLLQWLGYSYDTQVETNGSIPLWKSKARWSMDIKTPSSGNDIYNNYENIKILDARDQLKFVISDRNDFDFSKQYACAASLTNVIYQPAWKTMPLSTLIKWVVADKDLHHVRVGTQLHKVAFGAKKRGV